MKWGSGGWTRLPAKTEWYWAKYGIWGGVVKCTSLVTWTKYVANLFKKETEFATLVERAIKLWCCHWTLSKGVQKVWVVQD